MPENIQVRAEAIGNSITNGIITTFENILHEQDLELAVMCSTALFHPIAVTAATEGRNIQTEILGDQLEIHIESGNGEIQSISINSEQLIDIEFWQDLKTQISLSPTAYSLHMQARERPGEDDLRYRKMYGVRIQYPMYDIVNLYSQIIRRNPNVNIPLGAIQKAMKTEAHCREFLDNPPKWFKVFVQKRLSPPIKDTGLVDGIDIISNAFDLWFEQPELFGRSAATKLFRPFEIIPGLESHPHFISIDDVRNTLKHVITSPQCEKAREILINRLCIPPLDTSPEWRGARERMILPLILDFIEPGDRIIDLGCADGLYTNQLKRILSYAEVFACDIKCDSRIREEWQQKQQETGVQFFQADITKGIGLPSNSIKLALMEFVAGHIHHEKLLYAMQEIERILEPDGILIVGPQLLNGKDSPAVWRRFKKLVFDVGSGFEFSNLVEGQHLEIFPEN